MAVVQVVVFEEGDEGLSLERVDKEHGLEATGDVGWSMHRQLEGFESRTRARRCRRRVETIVTEIRCRARARPSGTLWVFRGGCDPSFRAPPGAVVPAALRAWCASVTRLQPAAIGELHHVLIADEVVWMFGDGEGGLGRTGPPFGGGQIAGFENAVDAELEERSRASLTARARDWGSCGPVRPDHCRRETRRPRRRLRAAVRVLGLQNPVPGVVRAPVIHQDQLHLAELVLQRLQGFPGQGHHVRTLVAERDDD